MSEAVLVAIISGAVTTIGAIITAILAYLSLKQSKVNAVKAADAAVVAEETTRKQDVLIEKTDVIHTATNSNLEKLRQEIDDLKSELKQANATSLRLAEASSPPTTNQE